MKKSKNMIDTGKQALVLLSGGVDSTTLLHFARLSVGHNTIIALGIDYGQRHVIELEHARKIVRGMSNAMYEEIKITMPTSSTLLEGTPWSGGAAVVPGRNAIFLAYAASMGVPYIYIGANRDDYGDYIDCRQPFFDAMQKALSIGSEIEGIYTPFIDMEKSDVVRLGLRLGVSYKDTWTCYIPDKNEPCMECAACQGRIIAMKENGVDYYGK